LIQSKAKYIAAFLYLCLKHYDQYGITCLCKDALEQIRSQDGDLSAIFESYDESDDWSSQIYTNDITNPETIQRWFHTFKNNNDYCCTTVAGKSTSITCNISLIVIN
jgi:hypothetical protein